MFILYADKSKLTVRQRETVTSGSVNVYDVQFEFSPDWDGLARSAVFNAGSETRSVRLDENGQCVIPWEVLTQPGRQLVAGVYGTHGDGLVRPTIRANLGTILEGVPTDSAGTRPPTPDLWEQKLAGFSSRLERTMTVDNVLSVSEILKIMEVN